MNTKNSHRRDQLLDAAIELIMRLGIRKASVDEIAQEARVSKGAVYLEFSSKRSLLEALIRREFSRYILDTCSRIESDPDGGRLSNIYRHSISALLERPFMRAIYEDNGRILDGLLQGPESYRPRVLLGVEFLRKMVEAGLVRADVDLAATSHVLGVLSVGPLLAEPVLGDESTPSLETTFSLLAELVVSGLESGSHSDAALGSQAFREFAEGIEKELA